MATESETIWKCESCGKSFKNYVTDYYSEYPGAPRTSEYAMCPYCGSTNFDDKGKESEVSE